ncbi:MAG: HNH endonuclease [Caldilinea sp. CFX5]|nr:HNH endonuclease [Caldilinea sp. CFX5]
MPALSAPQIIKAITNAFDESDASAVLLSSMQGNPRRFIVQLIDAAHILPVGAEGSTDEISNGICLSPTYHRAFDRALIYLDDAWQMQINPAKEQELIASGLDGGLDYFKTYLGMRIHLPADRSSWPRLEYIREANTFRGVK